MELQVDELLRFANRVLSEKRFQHSVGVADCAAAMAKHHGLDSHKARCAGLAHDLAKEISLPEQLLLARHWGLLHYPEDEQSPKILHGPLAAYFLQHYFKVDDMEILAAIACHTLGRPEMTPLDMLIYSADWTEPNRDFPEVDFLRRSLYDDLEQGTLNCVEQSIDELRSNNMPVHPLTQLAYEDLRRRKDIGIRSRNP